MEIQIIRGQVQAQCGVALISILLLLTVLATLAIYAAEHQDIAIRRVENQSLAEQGYQVNLSGEQWVVKVLERDMEDDLATTDGEQSAMDHNGEIWGNLGPPVEVGDTGTTLLMTVEDLQGRLNVNNLLEGKQRKKTVAEGDDDQQEQQSPDQANNESDEAVPEQQNEAGQDDENEAAYWYQIFQNLFIALELNPALVDPVIDWVDPDQESIGTTGAEDFYYSGLDYPYRSANGNLASTSEIALIKDFTPEVVVKILPWISALPVVDNTLLVSVNVNTASAMVLAAFAAEQPLDSEILQQLVLRRESLPFASLQEFADEYAALVPAGLVQGYENMLDISSNFYAGRSCAESGRVKFSMTSLMQKQTPGNNVKVLQRERFFGCPAFAKPESG